MFIFESKSQSQNDEESPKKTPTTSPVIITPPPHAEAENSSAEGGSTVRSKPLHDFPLPHIKRAAALNWNRFPKLTINEPHQQPESDKLAVMAAVAAADVEDAKSPLKKRLAVEAVREAAKVADFDNLPLKTWNLRPRKKTEETKNAYEKPNATAGSSKTGGADKKGKKKADEVKFPKFRFTLTQEEIEEDIFQMTGKLPSRKPSKRNKNHQQQLDMLTPGLGLDSIKPGRYKVDPP